VTPTRIDESELARRLADFPQWQLDAARPAIRRGFRFASFRDAFAFMTRVALVAERLDHHPEWFNVYDRVDVALTTHSAGGVTANDLALAAEIDACYERFAPAGPAP
jgi:4a-hydroxytetrahydrobiopterin dehydratase